MSPFDRLRARILSAARDRLRRFVGEPPRRLSIDRPQSLPAAPAASFQATDFDLFDRWIEHPAQGLTPRLIGAIHVEAEQGYPARQCDLYDDVVETDAHLRSQLDQRRDDVAGKQWVVLAGGDSAADVRAARLLEDALRAVPNVQETIAHQLGVVRYGYAGTEVDWAMRGGLLVPIWFRNVLPRRFRFSAHDEPMLLTAANMYDGEPLVPGRWIFSRLPGRRVATSGLGRTFVWWSLFKRLAVRDWVVFCEKFALPYVTGEYQAGASDNDKAVLQEAVRSLGKDNAAVFSDACKMVIHTVQTGGGASNVQGALVDLVDGQISKLVSGGTLASSEGSANGSYAQAEIHQTSRFSLVVADEARLASRFEADVGTPFVAYNRLAARPPRLKVHISQTMSPAERMDLYVKAAGIGCPIDPAQFRAEFNFQPPTGDPLPGPPRIPSAPTTPPPPASVP
jgi:phage gp29-like protein